MSNTLKRILVGFAGIPLIIASVFFGDIYFLSFCVLVQSLCIWEFLKMFENKELHPIKSVSIIISIGLFILLWQKIYTGLLLLIIPVLLEVFREKKRNPLNAIVQVFGFIYITIPFVLLNELDINPALVLYIFILIWSCDTFAYFGGKFFGKHKLTSISPKKTIEGAIIGLLFTVVASVVFYYLKSDIFGFADSIILGLLIGVLSQVGDNFESMLKRYTEIKDSSNIIPGHGGLLDRFDSLIFIVPVIYAYIKFLK